MRPLVPLALSTRATARLERMVREELAARKTAQLRIAERLGHIERDMAKAEDVAARLVGSWRTQVEASAWRTRPFEPAMTIDAAWRRHPGTQAIFARHHLPGCDGCAVRHDETLAEAADAYGLMLEPLLHELNDLLQPDAMVHPSPGSP
jgi:hybrid cluster-associated redox disulfide protein